MTPDPPAEPEGKRSRIWIPRADLLICVAIVLSVFAAYSPVARFGFVGLDDFGYVSENVHLRAGLTSDNLKWVFLSFDPDNWFPVTRLSLLLDYHLFGAEAAGYHIENVLIHAMAALLLFGFLRRATHVRWPCAFVALMFGLHPLHVESVAWVAERKDVLCAFFWFATLWAWLRYTERPAGVRYVDALVLFALGLMAKPMIVTLPFLLLLLDIWPLRRGLSRKLLFEKLPFFAVSGAGMVVTVLAQRSAHATQSLATYPPFQRLANALVTVAIYTGKTFWPAHLWIPYASTRHLPAFQVFAAAAGIAAVTGAVLTWIRKRPYLAVGWFWFLGTLVPVIGLMQVGQQARADRYTYVPMVGLSIMLAWGGAEILAGRPALRKWAAALATAACLAMAAKTTVQTQYWRDTEALYLHAIDMDRQDYLAWNYLALTLSANRGLAEDIISYYRSAERIRPDVDFIHTNLGAILAENGRSDEGIEEYRKAIRIDPCTPVAHYNLGIEYGRKGLLDQAIAEVETALRCDGRFAHAHEALGVMLFKKGRHAEGLRHLEKAVELDPDFARGQCNLGYALIDTPGRLADSIPHFKEALRLDPRYVAAYMGLARVLIRVPRLRQDAIANVEAAERLEPDPERRKFLERMEEAHADSEK